jgi:hypothetical protein
LILRGSTALAGTPLDLATNLLDVEESVRFYGDSARYDGEPAISCRESGWESVRPGGESAVYKESARSGGNPLDLAGILSLRGIR